MLDFDFERMLFKIPPEKHDKESLTDILTQHPEVEFVSFVGLDIAGNDTDERIPVKLFLNDMDDMLEHGAADGWFQRAFAQDCRTKQCQGGYDPRQERQLVCRL